VLHHAANTEKTIREVHRVLKPRGEALIMLYHRRSLNELVHRLLRVPFEERDELCPVVRRFTRDEVRGMFAQFSSVDIAVEYLFGEGYGALFRVIPRWLYDMLSRHIGWHLMIRGRK
jgi:ubiquinone/menaquinone biosynthesis C-methylase UbiE